MQGRTVLDEIKECIVQAHALCACSAGADEKNAAQWSNLRCAWAVDELETALSLLDSVDLVNDGRKPS